MSRDSYDSAEEKLVNNGWSRREAKDMLSSCASDLIWKGDKDPRYQQMLQQNIENERKNQNNRP